MSKIITVSPDLQVWQALPKVVSTILKKNKGVVPDIQAVQKGVIIPKSRLQEYNVICGFAESEFIPSTFLYVLSQAVQMTLLTQKEVPFALVGMIHFGNRIRQYRPVSVDETFDLTASFGPMVAHEKGQAFEVLIKAEIQGELVWDCVGVYLRTGARGQGEPFSWVDEPVSEHAIKESWHLDSWLGIRYGKISGDYNPIHMHPLTAKLFGMPRHIIHGMYNKGRILGQLLPKLDAEAYEISVSFKVPVYLPADIIFRYNAAENGFVFDVVDREEVKPHLKGYLKKI
jgi:acyl dehydratase